jgi:elongation factor G
MQTFNTQQIRNVALLSHTGAGKTTLSESLLFSTGALSRMGRVEDGTTASDYEAEAVKRRSSIQLALLPCLVNGHKVNVLDTPGYFDFVGEVISALRVVDGAVIVVAANSGVEVGTELAWKRAQDAKLPIMVFVNKMDRENADFGKVVQQVQERLGRHCVPLQMPVGAAHTFKGVVGLLGGASGAPADMKQAVEQARERITEAVAETDDALATKFLEGKEISGEELAKALHAGVMSGTFVPVFCGSAVQQAGVKELLNAIITYFPSPAERPIPANGAALKPDASAPVAALVFKSTADQYVGKLNYLRIYQGTLSSNTEVMNTTKGQSERLGQLFVMRGKTQDPVPSLAAGDIGAVAKLAVTGTGDTLVKADHLVKLPGLTFPPPLYTLAVSPKSKGDSDKLSPTLARLTEEDPSLVFSRDPDTHETLLSGQGDVHLDMAFQRAERKFGVHLAAQLPRVPYRETITGAVQVEHRFKQQSGGHGHFAHIVLKLEPAARGSGLNFATAVSGGAVPREFFPYVEKGVLRACAEGVIAGFPVIDTKVTLTDGSFHAVDSAGMDFETCAHAGFLKGFQQDNPQLLEPIASLKITVPDGSTGDVIGDLNSKRGRILGMNPNGDGTTLVEAEAPLTEVQKYALDLRAMTHGRGTFTVSVARHEPMPPHLQQKVIEQAGARKD